MKYKNFNQQAFTILELMIATMVFSVILLLVTTGILNIGKTYYKGALQARTQGTARNIIDEISRSIQFTGVTPWPTIPLNAASTPYPKPGGEYWACINNINYSYVIDRQLDTDVSKALISYDSPCFPYSPSAVPAARNPKELLGKGMRLTALEVMLVPGNSDVYNVTVEVASGEIDLFNLTAGISSSCKSGVGSQFCAISRLSTTVKKRVL